MIYLVQVNGRVAKLGYSWMGGKGRMGKEVVQMMAKKKRVLSKVVGIHAHQNR